MTIWNCQEPKVWPPPPGEMTFSTLIEMEACPRRWALQTADYQELWNGIGYPPRLFLHGLLGSIVHYVVETVARELVRSGCASLDDPQAIDVMRRLGGYSKLITESVEFTVGRCRQNPRAKKVLPHMEMQLRGKGSELRTKIQSLLKRVNLDVKSSNVKIGSAKRLDAPLMPGLHSEVTLRAPDLRWKGKPDLIALGVSSAEIIEFKTGERDVEHALQIHIYSVLWGADKQANPKGLPIRKLTLAYPDGHEDVPVPSAEESAKLIKELQVRTATVLQEVAQRPLPAHPSIENCRFCGVKQLCLPYWSPDMQQPMQTFTAEGCYVNAEVLIISQHGPTSWDATIAKSWQIVAGTQILIRGLDSGLEIRAGDRLRFMDLWVGADVEDSQIKVANAGNQCEMYLVSRA